MKVKVVAHGDHIVCIPSTPEKNIGHKGQWWPTGDGKLGCVIGNTKKNLGVSQEAIDLMKKVEMGTDAIGDIDWWWCDNETYAFSWFGPIFRIIDATDSVSAREFRPHPDQCTIIPNEVPEAAIKAIQAGEAVWGEPWGIEKPKKKKKKKKKS